jgi:hypothetical protein
MEILKMTNIYDILPDLQKFKQYREDLERAAELPDHSDYQYPAAVVQSTAVKGLEIIEYFEKIFEKSIKHPDPLMKLLAEALKQSNDLAERLRLEKKELQNALINLKK